MPTAGRTGCIRPPYHGGYRWCTIPRISRPGGSVVSERHRLGVRHLKPCRKFLSVDVLCLMLFMNLFGFQISELAMSPNTWCFLSPTHLLIPHRDRASRYCVALCKIAPDNPNGIEFLTLFHFPDEAVYNLSRSHVSVFSDPTPLPGSCPPGRPFFIDSERVIKIEWLAMDFSRRVDWVEIYVSAKSFLPWADAPTPPLFVSPNFQSSPSTDSDHESDSASTSSESSFEIPFSHRRAHFLFNDELAAEADEQPQGQSEWYGTDGMRHVAWEAWGPQNSRMMWKIGHDNEFQCFTFGTRSVSLTGSSKISVRTFGGRRSGWGKTITANSEGSVPQLRPENGNRRAREHDNEDEELTMHWFPRSEVSTTVFHQLGEAADRRYYSSLPHHLARRDIGFTLRGVYSHGVMCDDEHIVLVEVSLFLWASRTLVLRGLGTGDSAF